jgi:hypothetical protein
MIACPLLFVLIVVTITGLAAIMFSYIHDLVESLIVSCGAMFLIVMIGWVMTGKIIPVKTVNWPEYVAVRADEWSVALGRGDKELIRYKKETDALAYEYYKRFSGEYLLVNVSQDFNMYGEVVGVTIKP